MDYFKVIDCKMINVKMRNLHSTYKLSSLTFHRCSTHCLIPEMCDKIASYEVFSKTYKWDNRELRNPSLDFLLLESF